VETHVRESGHGAPGLCNYRGMRSGFTRYPTLSDEAGKDGPPGFVRLRAPFIKKTIQDVIQSNTNKPIFRQFPDSKWLCTALASLYSKDVRNKKKKDPGESRAIPRAKSISRDQDMPPIHTRHMSGNLEELSNQDAILGPHPLLNLSSNAAWRGLCPMEFPKGLKTLEEAASNSTYLRLWKGQLPELDHEIMDDVRDIAGMIFSTAKKNLAKISVSEGGRDVTAALAKEACMGVTFYQLSQPNLDQTQICAIRNVNLLGARSMSPKKAWILGAPVCEQEPKQGIQINATPRGYFTDLHIGKPVLFSQSFANR
jgi:hypothetical protein